MPFVPLLDLMSDLSSGVSGCPAIALTIYFSVPVERACRPPIVSSYRVVGLKLFLAVSTCYSVPWPVGSRGGVCLNFFPLLLLREMEGETVITLWSYCRNPRPKAPHLRESGFKYSQL